MFKSDMEKEPTVTSRERAPSSSTSSLSTLESSLKGTRTARFAEATTVYPPVDRDLSQSDDFRAPRTQSYIAQAQVADVGFGYISQNDSSRYSQGVPVEVPLTPASPLKSAMKIPGTPGRRIINPLSPTFKEEEHLEEREEMTEKEQAKDLKIKTRVRIAKFLLRSVNFSCSLIVLSMLSYTFAIFDATKSLPARNNLPAWATGTKTWPQDVVLATSCVSLALCLVVFYNYWKGGHKRAEKVAVYYTLFAVAFFFFSTVMWALAAGILQGSRANGQGKDIWGWSCNDNERRQLFSQKVDYALVCRLQNWSLVCCLIEVILECITILLYGIVFYRYYSKQRLRKSMDIRDRARADLYLAQLRTQSAPNTPGFGPLSPSYSQHMTSPRFPPSIYNNTERACEEGMAGTRFIEAKTAAQITAKPFTLQVPPVKAHPATPKSPQTGFTTPATVQPMPPASKDSRIDHVEAAPGEQTYEAVPIPGAYATTKSTSE